MQTTADSLAHGIRLIIQRREHKADRIKGVVLAADGLTVPAEAMVAAVVLVCGKEPFRVLMWALPMETNICQSFLAAAADLVVILGLEMAAEFFI